MSQSFHHKLLWLLLVYNILIVYSQEQPNIIFIYIDDVGFNDFGFNGNTQTQTPFIDNLVSSESLLIWNNYVSFVCSPTRASFLSGRYPSHLGLQHSVFTQNSPYSLTRQVSLLSNEFQSSGYTTHLIGKYHLGYQAQEYTPTYRGFDTFNGYYNGQETYFTHESYVKFSDLIFYDLRNNEDTDDDHETYSVYWTTQKTTQLLDDVYDNDNPFFLYLAFQAAHYPPQAPLEYSSKYCNPLADTDSSDTDTGSDSDDVDNTIESNLRHPILTANDPSSSDTYLTGDCTANDLHMAQVTSIDDSMEIIINKIKELNIWDNTLIVFSSDNGAAMYSGDNAPLRGAKTSSFEGGVRVPGFITGGLLNDDRKGEILNEFPVHAVDWYPTLLSASNLNINYERSKKLYSSDLNDINNDIDLIDTKWDYIEDNNIIIDLDGMDIWNAIQYNEIGDDLINREILIHLDEIDCPYESCGAIRIGDWKYIRGPYVCSHLTCGWNNDFMTDPENNILGCPMLTDDDTDNTDSTESEITLDNKGITKTGNDKASKETAKRLDDIVACSDASGCLFNLANDPCEFSDLSGDEDYSDIVTMMQERLLYYQQMSVLPLMDNDEIVLDDDLVNPNIVCDSDYWCPYMDYDDVEFEGVLYDEYLRVYGSGDIQEKLVNENIVSDEGNQIGYNYNMILCIIGMFTLLGIIVLLYISIKSKQRMEDLKNVYGEVTPLIH